MKNLYIKLGYNQLNFISADIKSILQKALLFVIAELTIFGIAVFVWSMILAFGHKSHSEGLHLFLLSIIGIPVFLSLYCKFQHKHSNYYERCI